MISAYVIGSSAEIDRAERAIAALHERGVDVTHDWTRDIRRAREHGHASDSSLCLPEQRMHADADLYGIERADVLLLLWPERASFGAGVEWGYALALVALVRGDQRLAISAPVASPHVFTSYASTRFTADEDAIAWIAGLRSAT